MPLPVQNFNSKSAASFNPKAYRDEHPLANISISNLSFFKIYVPVQDQNFPTNVGVVFLTNPGSYRNVVKEAESHGSIFLGMMARWSNYRNRILHNLLNDGFAGFDCASGGEK